MTWFPQARASLTGKRIETGGALITQENADILLEVPEENPGLLELSSIYYADIEAALDLVLRPALTFRVVSVAEYELLAFEIPIELASVAEERAFAPVEYEHPLPSLENIIASHDFGEVDVGNLSNAFVDFSNIGYMDLEGWVSIEGSDAFTVYPEYVHATQGNIDGVVVTYEPTGAEVESAMLVVESNDSMRPLIEIPLTGEGFYDDSCYTEGEQEATLSTCGCSAGGGLSGLSWVLLGGLGALIRRRR
ncbi:MAG: hypothetical protein JXX28_05985 [Deltaproteobacteria bacterium]|nr:hypothetical protein [Deltaproteobacteria bacterium]